MSARERRPDIETGKIPVKFPGSGIFSDFERITWFRIPLSPPFFWPPPDSLNQSQFAQPPLKPVDTKGFTNHVTVCLKHTQTPGSGRFSGKIRRFQSEF